MKCKGPCEGIFHKKCVPKANLKSEICEKCSKKEGSPAARCIPKLSIDINEATPENVLDEVNKKLEIIYKMEEKIDKMEEKIESLKDNVDFYAQKYQEMTDFKKNAEKKIAALEKKNLNLQKINESLEERITQLELKEVETEVEIVGVEQVLNENTKDLIATIGQKLEMDVNEIESARRVGRQKPDEKRPRPIVVKLRSKVARAGWLKHRKTMLTNKDLLGNDNNNRIYINENLTKQMRSLFWNTKTSLKGTYKYIWVQDLKILIKKTDASKIYNIKCDADIQRHLGTDNEASAS